MTADWNKLIEGHELAFFREDLATSSPQAYTVDEMRLISEEMDASAAEVEAAMRPIFSRCRPTFASA